MCIVANMIENLGAVKFSKANSIVYWLSHCPYKNGTYVYLHSFRCILFYAVVHLGAGLFENSICDSIVEIILLIRFNGACTMERQA